jgi:hypothetical protein
MTEHLQLSGVSIHPTAAEVQSDDGRDQYRIGVAQTYAMLGRFDKLDEATERARGFLKMALDHLDSPKVGSMNIQTIDVAPADSFELVRDRLVASLMGSDAEALGGTVGLPLSDMSWSAEFGDPNRKISVRLGPMQSEQLSELVQDQDADSPPNMLFLEVSSDLQVEEDNARNVLESWAKAVDTHRMTTTRIGDWLKEMLTK